MCFSVRLFSFLYLMSLISHRRAEITLSIFLARHTSTVFLVKRFLSEKNVSYHRAKTVGESYTHLTGEKILVLMTSP